MLTKKIMVLGCNGMLGMVVVTHLRQIPGLVVHAVSRKDCDVTNQAAFRSLLEAAEPDWIINCTAFLTADRCEQEPEQSYLVNYLAVKNMVAVLQSLKPIPFIHISTDFVFDGKIGGYDEAALARPLSYYGLHKYMADTAILHAGLPAYVLRVASLIGAGPGKRDLIKALLARIAATPEGETPQLAVVDEYKISATTTDFVANTIGVFIDQQPDYGLYNTVTAGVTSWFAIARVALDALGVGATITPILASAFPVPAPRPMQSWLKTDKLATLLNGLPDWESAIRQQMAGLSTVYHAVLQDKKAA